MELVALQPRGLYIAILASGRDLEGLPDRRSARRHEEQGDRHQGEPAARGTGRGHLRSRLPNDVD